MDRAFDLAVPGHLPDRQLRSERRAGTQSRTTEIEGGLE
jgi:hypothetical protein